MLLTGTEAEVLVEFIVDTTGRVRDAKCVRSPHPAFAEPAVSAITAWRFLPGYKNGHAINVRVAVPIIFDMKGVDLPNREAETATPPAAGIPVGS